MITLVYMSVFMPVLNCFDYCGFVICFKIWKYEILNFLKIFFVVVHSSSLQIAYEFLDQSTSAKTTIVILIEIALKL